jgi:hypothetical protein
MRVHDAELNSIEQIFCPLIYVTLGCFRIQERKHLTASAAKWSFLMVDFSHVFGQSWRGNQA